MTPLSSEDLVERLKRQAWCTGNEHDATLMIQAAADLSVLEGEVERLRGECRWFHVFAEMRSTDEPKVFARVARGALRTIAERARAALSLLPDLGEEQTVSQSQPILASNGQTNSEPSEQGEDR